MSRLLGPGRALLARQVSPSPLFAPLSSLFPTFDLARLPSRLQRRQSPSRHLVAASSTEYWGPQKVSRPGTSEKMPRAQDAAIFTMYRAVPE